MRDDTKRELERLERKLLQQEEQQTDEELLEDLKGILREEPVVEPAFDDPQTIHTPKEPMVYTNFANDYGRVPAEETPEEGPKKKRKPEKLTLGLLITACLLTLGIIGVLLYWLLFLLR